MATILVRKTAKGKPRYTARVRKLGYELVETFSNRKDAEDWARNKENQIQRGQSLVRRLDVALREERDAEKLARLVELDVRDDRTIGGIVEVKKGARPNLEAAGSPFMQLGERAKLGQKTGQPIESGLAA